MVDGNDAELTRICENIRVVNAAMKELRASRSRAA